MSPEEKIAKTIGCNSCHLCSFAHLLGKIPLWQYGTNFEKSKYKILFVGKTARGNSSPSYYSDADKYKDLPWAFWSYTRGIYTKLGLSWEDVAITNLVKCNASMDVDTTSQEVKENCICKQQFIKKEIQLLRPAFIVFYTNTYYDAEISSLFDKITEVTDRKFKIRCGKRKICFWQFKGHLKNDSSGTYFYVLRLAHPSRKNKTDFINLVTQFILRPDKIPVC